MTLSYLQVAQAIEDEISRLADLSEQIARAYDEESEAAIAWKSRRAHHRLQMRETHQGDRLPAEWYEDSALQAFPDDFARHVRAINRLALLREGRNVATARLDALRTLAAGMRAAGG